LYNKTPTLLKECGCFVVAVPAITGQAMLHETAKYRAGSLLQFVNPQIPLCLPTPTKATILKKFQILLK
jgi:hypothetical protein